MTIQNREEYAILTHIKDKIEEKKKTGKSEFYDGDTSYLLT
jgi:hypothetical protein